MSVAGTRQVVQSVCVRGVGVQGLTTHGGHVGTSVCCERGVCRHRAGI